MKRINGFSFIELLVTIAILGILATIAAVSFRGANKNARDTQRRAEIQEIKGGIEEYRLVSGVYPNVDSSSQGILLSALQPDYLSRNYVDPLNKALNGVSYYYHYNYVGASGCSYALYALMENDGNVQLCPSECGVSLTNIYCVSE